MLNQATLKIGIIGDGFMNPSFFRKALEEKLSHRDVIYREIELDWPISVKSTKKISDLPIGEFVGRPEDYFDFLEPDSKVHEP